MTLTFGFRITKSDLNRGAELAIAPRCSSNYVYHASGRSPQTSVEGWR